MQSKAFNMFGRYHYGQIKSLGIDVHDIIKQNAQSIQSRKDALNHLSFVAFNLAVIYPMVWDKLAKATFGDDYVARRSGSATIPNMLWNIVVNDEHWLVALREAYALPPATQAAAELADATWNRRSQVRTNPGKWAAAKVPVSRDITDVARGKGKEYVARTLFSAKKKRSGEKDPVEKVKELLNR
jgi:hypothetical protein